MTPSIEVINEIPVGNDPFLLALKWIAVLVVIIMAGAAPVMMYLRRFKSDAVANTRDDAAITLYEQLQAQIKQNSEDIKTLVSEKNKWFEEATRLKSESEITQTKLKVLEDAEITIKSLCQKLDQYENVIQDLRKRLDEKDETLRTRDLEIRDLLRDMMSLKDQMHHLEARLRLDEKKFCQGCQWRKEREGSGGDSD